MKCVGTFNASEKFDEFQSSLEDSQKEAGAS